MLSALSNPGYLTCYSIFTSSSLSSITGELLIGFFMYTLISLSKTIYPFPTSHANFAFSWSLKLISKTPLPSPIDETPSIFPNWENYSSSINWDTGQLSTTIVFFSILVFSFSCLDLKLICILLSCNIFPLQAFKHLLASSVVLKFKKPNDTLAYIILADWTSKPSDWKCRISMSSVKKDGKLLT